MNSVRGLLAALVCAPLVLSLAACGGDTGVDGGDFVGSQIGAQGRDGLKRPKVSESPEGLSPGGAIGEISGCGDWRADELGTTYFADGSVGLTGHCFNLMWDEWEAERDGKAPRRSSAARPSGQTNIAQGRGGAAGSKIGRAQSELQSRRTI